tara:strand:+ start:61 stop:321 length:261 start_codon:yes stop_codon:yes gene_type:complete
MQSDLSGLLGGIYWRKKMLDEIIEDFWGRTELKKNDNSYIANDDTQVGIEFCFEKMMDGNQLISEKAITYLYENHPEAYKGFYDKL